MDLTQILEREAEEARAGRAAVWSRYAELLQEEGPDVTRSGEMQAIAKAIGKRPEDVEADRRVVARASALRRAADGAARLADRRVAARQAVEAFQVDTERLIRERQANLQRLELAADELSKAQAGTEDAGGELSELVRQHPFLLADAMGAG